MEPRAIGTTDLFETQGFTSETLKVVPRNLVNNNAEDTARACRYPYANCRQLLPCLGVQAQHPPPQAEYDKDLDAADVNPS
jgi:hypothetical protein